MGSVNFINGGLDVQELVEKFISLEREPIRRLEKQSKNYQDRVSAYQTFNTKLLSFKTSAESILFNGETVPLSIPTDFNARLKTSVFALRKATSSDKDVLEATANKGISGGNYSITVSNLAEFNTFASNNFASDTSTTTRTGTLVIQKGTSTPVTITVDTTNNTLQGIKNAINNQNAGFTASIINDGSATPYKLVITSNDSGTANALTITNNLTGGAGQAVTLTETVAAEDAALTVNGVSITSSSNTVTTAIEGVTLTLKNTSATAVNVLVERDIDAIVTNLKDFTTKYNDVVSFLSSQFKYDTTKKQAGILSGDSTLRDAQSRLSKTLNQSIDSDSASLTLLAEIGIKVGNDGTLTVDESKLKDSLSTKFNDTAHVVLANALDQQGNTISIAPQLQSQLKSLTDPLNGYVFFAKDGAQQAVTRLTKQIEAYELRLATRKEILTREFARADRALRLLSALQTSLTNQAASLAKING